MDISTSWEEPRQLLYVYNILNNLDLVCCFLHNLIVEYVFLNTRPADL